jgi:arsenate reductase
MYHNPRCSKSRQTLEILRENNVEPEIIDYLKDVPSKQELSELIQLLGIEPVELIRKGEADYKDNFKGKTLTQQEWIQAMLDYPKLIERPIVVKGKMAVLGRPPENVLELF